MPTLQSFLVDQRSLVEELECRTSIAYWNSSLSGSKEDELLAASLVTELQSKFSDPSALEFLVSLPEPQNHDLRRQRKLLIDTFKGHQSSPEVLAELASREMEIESLFSNFRAVLRGTEYTDNQLRDIFKVSNDSVLRQEAWEASKQIGAASAPKVLELVALRNSEAKRLGYDNYYSMQIELQELNESELFEILDSVSRELEPLFTSYKADIDKSLARRFGISVDEIKPWHYSNPFFQDAPDSEEIDLDSYFVGKDLTKIAKEFFAEIGFDIAPLLARSDLYEKPGKMQHAYCTGVGRGTHDIRVLCNVVSNAEWMGTLLHEFGHAVYDDLVDDELPFFLKGITHIMTTEAIAEMMGRFVNDGSWLQRYAGVSKDDAEKVASASQITHRAHLLIFTQWVMVMAHFERELYRDPEQDLGKLWWDLVEKHQHLSRPDGDRSTDWAAKIHLATSPVYYHNYLLGEMTASQILWALKRDERLSDEEPAISPKVGSWLTEKIFRPGARYDWNDLLEHATGERLNSRHFIDGLSI
jgi:peptidyl-dipeptidase A